MDALKIQKFANVFAKLAASWYKDKSTISGSGAFASKDIDKGSVIGVSF